MKKILILTNHSYMLWRFRRELIQRLQETCEVVLSTPFVGHEQDFERLGIRCIETKINRRGINPLQDFGLLQTYRKLIRSERPDLVLSYSIKPNIYGGIVCAREGIPYFCNVQGLGTAFERPAIAKLVRVLYRYAFRKVEKVFFENNANSDLFVALNIVPLEKTICLSGAGVNLEDYTCQPYPENDVPHFLYLGRIMAEKGVDELFAASRRLWNEGCRFRLDVVGFYEDDYEDQISGLERDDIAAFHGFVSDPKPYYAAADCVVMPSYHEGMSNVLLESGAMGRPVITSDIPGCREAVCAEQSGFLVPPRDTNALKVAMERFMKLPRAEREAMGLRARKHMERHFDRAKVVNQIYGVITGIL